MPLSTICTVSSGPRAWSSYSNIRAKDVERMTSMNSAEEISKYKEPINNYYSPTLTRRTLGYSYDFPEKSPKKEKKWSIGSLFRRKKKDDSNSSSEDDLQKKGFLNRRKRKPDKRKKPTKTVGSFDHVVMSHNSHVYPNGCNGHEDPGILSDPTGGFGSYIGRALPKIPTQLEQSNHTPAKTNKDCLEDINNSRASLASGSADSLTKRNRKGLAKVRAEARRNTLKHNSSSDEDSQRSASSSKFRSDESLPNTQRDLNRRSRAARTERYWRRHSKDGENPKDYLRLTKSDAENSTFNWMISDDSNRSPSRSPIVPTKNKSKTSYSSLSSQSPSISGLSTIPPSHGNHSWLRASNSVNNPSYKPPLSLNEYNNSIRKNFENSRLLDDNNFSKQRSVSCDANIHKAPVTEIEPEIMHVQFPIGKTNSRYRNLSLINSTQLKQPPPPPPPRDPRRLVTAQYYDNVRPNTYYFDNTGQFKSKSFNVNSNSNHHQQAKKFSSFNLRPNYRSTSEDQLAKDLSQPIHLLPRPSSTTPDATISQKRPTLKSTSDDYNYLMDKKPRSRKPIFIQTNNSNSQIKKDLIDKSGTQKVLDFWKKKDLEGINNNPETSKMKKSEPSSPQMFTCQTHVQTQVFLPSVLHNDMNSSTENFTENPPRDMSPFKSISPCLFPLDDNVNENEIQKRNSFDEEERIRNEDMKRKSANLEEALVELEAIYNSLRLGDEDLLERAEQRERDAVAQKLIKSKSESYPTWGTSRGTLSDSSFSYEPFDTVDSPRRKRLLKKSKTVDRRGDDMAYRKLNKERSVTINDPQSVISKVSYLQSCPLYNNEYSNENNENYNKKTNNEPDITLDDVVYRNVKYANNSLKVTEPQPPFGIPLGPIALAANSDYLHAVPNNIHRPVFKPRKIPDLVKDDLAFRNLRKDPNKEPALPPVSADDLKNNNTSEVRTDLNALKKKRAVRSLSANIGSLVRKDVLEKALGKYKYQDNNENEPNTLTDIADAMEIARQVLKEKENKISATRKAFMSDTDTNNLLNRNYSISNNETLTESRLNFLNSLKTPSLQNDSHETNADSLRSNYNFLRAKPPKITSDKKSRSPKESTPIPISPLEEKILKKDEPRNSSFDDLLTALAVEARETSERITNELKQLSEEKSKNSLKSKDNNNINLNQKLLDIDAVSEQAKLCEKFLEGVVDSTELMSSTKSPLEEVKQINTEPLIPESVANIVLTRGDEEIKKDVVNGSKQVESDHDYENLVSDKELNIDEFPCREETIENSRTCVSPFEEHKAELIASFQELKENDILTKDNTNKSVESDKYLNKTSQPLVRKDSIYDNLEVAEKTNMKNDEVTGEECVDVLEVPNKECAFFEASSFNRSNQNLPNNCAISVNTSNINNTISSDVDALLVDSHINSRFRLKCFCSGEYLNEITNRSNSFNSLESLKSPKLVLETSKLSKAISLCDNCDIHNDNEKKYLIKYFKSSSDSFLNLPGTSSNSQTRVDSNYKIPRDHHNGNNLTLRENVSSSNQPGNIRDDDDEKQISAWYCDPATVAVACSYGIACAHQLASLDLVAILGILFAVISFIAALIF